MITFSKSTIDIAQTVRSTIEIIFNREQEKQLLNSNHKEYDEKNKNTKRQKITSGKYKQHLEEKKRKKKKIKYT